MVFSEHRKCIELTIWTLNWGVLRALYPCSVLWPIYQSIFRNSVFILSTISDKSLILIYAKFHYNACIIGSVRELSGQPSYRSEFYLWIFILAWYSPAMKHKKTVANIFQCDEKIDIDFFDFLGGFHCFRNKYKYWSTLFLVYIGKWKDIGRV